MIDTKHMRVVAILALTGIAAAASVATGEVRHSRESALELAYGHDAVIESREIFLGEDEQAAASRTAGTEIASRLVRRYDGYRDGELIGFAYFETHKVRSLPETLMIVIEPTGRVAAVHVLAFHEPEAYLPHEGFLRQFEGAGLDAELSLRSGIQGIAGSTFTANAVTAAVRRVLAIHTVVGKRSEEGGRP